MLYSIAMKEHQQSPMVPYYINASAMALPAVLIGLLIPSWLGMILSITMERQADFRAFYSAGYAVRTGHSRELYQYAAMRQIQNQTVAADGGVMPFIHPAYEALLFVPLTWFSYHVAYLLWGCVNLGVLFWCYRLLRPRLLPLAEIVPWLPAVLLPAFLPVSFAIMNGQDSLVMLLVVGLAFWWLQKNQAVSGLLLGLAAFRFQFLLPILFLFLLWKAYRLLAGFVLSATAMLAVSVAVAGLNAQVEYVRLLRLLALFPYLQPLQRMMNLRGLCWAIHLNPWIVLPASVIVLAVAARVGRQRPREDQLMLALTASCLITYHLFLHDLSLLFLPSTLLLAAAVREQRWWTAGIIGLEFLILDGVWFAQDHFYLGISATMLVFVTSLLRRQPSAAHSEQSQSLVLAQPAAALLPQSN
jgi:hypothetical protein